MKMKTKSLLLLIVFLGSIIPVSSAAAENPAQRDFNDSLSLLYASRAILLDEEDISGGSRAPGEMLTVNPSVQPDVKDAAMANLIQATKDQRNSLDASCSQLKEVYSSSDRKCERQVLEDYCSTQRDKLNTRLGFLHKLRGDQRKLFTRLWHSVKRSGDNVWSAVGPVGRRLLRRVGPEVIEVVLSGGSLGLGMVRKIVIKEARSIGKGELERLLSSGMERLMAGQAAFAQAAGVGDCTPENLQIALDEEEDDGIDYVASLETQGALEDQITVSFTGQMSFQCDQFVGEGGDSQMMGKIPVVVNFDAGTYFGEASYSYVKDDGFLETITWTYQGTVSQDGVLLGTWSWLTTVKNVDVGVIGGKLNPSRGIITEDGSGLYLYNLQDMDTEMLGLFQAERDAIVSALAGYMDSSEYPPTCRQR